MREEFRDFYSNLTMLQHPSLRCVVLSSRAEQGTPVHNRLEIKIKNTPLQIIGKHCGREQMMNLLRLQRSISVKFPGPSGDMLEYYLQNKEHFSVLTSSIVGK